MNTKEKIRQFVNKARHDKAKSYEEAIDSEFGHVLCEVIVKKRIECNYTGKQFEEDFLCLSSGYTNRDLPIEDNLEHPSGYPEYNIIEDREVKIVRCLDSNQFDYCVLYRDPERYFLENEGCLDYKILGRPITALDVCWALNKKYVKKDYAPFYIYLNNFCYSDGDESHSSASLFVFEIIKSNGSHTVLEEWSDEVCENIVKLIDL